MPNNGSLESLIGAVDYLLKLPDFRRTFFSALVECYISPFGDIPVVNVPSPSREFTLGVYAKVEEGLSRGVRIVHDENFDSDTDETVKIARKHREITTRFMLGYIVFARMMSYNTDNIHKGLTNFSLSLHGDSDIESLLQFPDLSPGIVHALVVEIVSSVDHPGEMSILGPVTPPAEYRLAEIKSWIYVALLLPADELHEHVSETLETLERTVVISHLLKDFDSKEIRKVVIEELKKKHLVH
ncbi:MAG: hypothetical protein ACYDAZ_08150 [Thermoplasmataceae archaeon]